MYASCIIICEEQYIFSALLLPELGVARGFSSHFSIINFGLMVNKCMKKVTTSESFWRRFISKGYGMRIDVDIRIVFSLVVFS